MRDFLAILIAGVACLYAMLLWPEPAAEPPQAQLTVAQSQSAEALAAR